MLLILAEENLDITTKDDLDVSEMYELNDDLKRRMMTDLTMAILMRSQLIYIVTLGLNLLNPRSSFVLIVN